MELKQPAAADSEDLRLDNLNKKQPFRKHSNDKGEFILGETNPRLKSLSSDWEKTLAKKDQQTTTSGAHSEGVLRLNESAEKEIHLHVEADQIHEGLQLDNKSDPVWEPWDAKKPETTSPPEIAEVIERQPMVAPLELNTAPSPSLDPDLAAEALMHSQAVADIAKEHAQVAVAPSYKDQLPKEARDIMERLQPAKDHHIEQSAWHNIEVDNKTGRAVEEASFNYGDAFKDEQRTEANAFHTDGAVASASGQLAVSSPIFNNLNPEDAAILTNAQSLPTPAAAQVAIPRPQMNYGSGSRSNVDPLLWTILTVVIFAIVLALII